MTSCCTELYSSAGSLLGVAASRIDLLHTVSCVPVALLQLCELLPTGNNGLGLHCC